MMMFSKEDWLFKIYNGYGYEELRLSMNYKGFDGNMYYTKWLSYHEIMHLYSTDIVLDKPSRITKYKFIKSCSHRTIMDCEIVIDLDDRDYIVSHMGDTFFKYKFKNINCKLKHIIYCLRRFTDYKLKVFSTGSKGYHIHIILPKLRDMTLRNRELYKERIIGMYGGDMMKKSEKCMIALEYTPHWKSGKYKREIYI